MNTNNIDISVYVLTYNHKKYVAQALESILAQKTKYSYEIVISDDCSTDGTQEIIRSYINKYPMLIRGVFSEINQGIPKNIYKARCACKGRYIVNLAGDDYWINDNKLQIQTDFLEKNEKYLGVSTRLELRFDDDVESYLVLPKLDKCNKDITIKDYINGSAGVGIACPNWHGLMIRNLFLQDEYKEYFKIAQLISDKVDDAVDEVLFLRIGTFYNLDVITDVYRTSRGDKNRSSYNNMYSSLERKKQNIELLNRLDSKFGIEIDFSQRYFQALSDIYWEMLRRDNKEDYRNIIELSNKKNTSIKIKSYLYAVYLECRSRFLKVVAYFLSKVRKSN